MLAEAILRGEVDNELAAIVGAAIERTTQIDINLTPERYRQASKDLEVSLLNVLAQKRKMEEDGHSQANAVLVAAASLQGITERLGQYLNGIEI